MPDPIDEAIKAVSHPLRRQILQWLKEPEQYFPEQLHSFAAGVCAGQIHQRSGLSQSSASAHLALLEQAGLVRRHRIGQWHFFCRNEQAINAFLQQIGNEI